MDQLQSTYNSAIDHTKVKILEDLNHFLGDKKDVPSIEDYMEARINYVEQIWINVWLNKATNNISKQEKKQYLSSKGYETENVSRKIINHLFRNEMREYYPFDTIKWLHEKFADNQEDWLEMHKKARSLFLKKEEEERELKKKRKLLDRIGEIAEDLIEEHEEHLYLNVRHFTAKQLKEDFKNNPRYKTVDTFALEIKLQEIGVFEPGMYSKMEGFFEELTGDIHKTEQWGRIYFAYETYFDRYEKMVSDYLSKYLPQFITEHLPQEIKSIYKEISAEDMSPAFLEEELLFPSEILANEFMEEIQEEYIEDLFRIADIPFSFDKHYAIYLEDLAQRERKKAEELAELERKREEERRIIADIFGHEYHPAIDPNVKYILHIGETNTGKTHHALERMKKAGSGIYLAPLRLLALEVCDKLNDEGTPCSLKTGEEEKIMEGANHISCTVEMFHEKDYYDCVVIDEAQMLSDRDRGFSWYKAITKARASEVHIIGSVNAKGMILELLGDAQIEVFEYSRDIPLEVEKREFKINRVQKGDALICFSRRRVLETASRLENSGHSVSMIYGSMPPETRKKQVQRFIKGETSIVVSTDAIGMGLNLPIRRVVFLENEKFDGQKRRRLTSQEVKQIAGRAGRKGLYNVGKVAFTANIKDMWDLLISEDAPIQSFSVAPTNAVFERFQRYFRDLGTFFELWGKFHSPKGTKKATLSEERELYERIKGTEIEAKLPIMDLYGFLHLPFSKKEPELIFQWEQTMYAILAGSELPEPKIKKRNLEELELTYKAIGLHLLFLYRLERRTEAIYWERVREEISDGVHDRLKTDVKNMGKKCRRCGKKLDWDHPFQICDACHERKYRRNYAHF